MKRFDIFKLYPGSALPTPTQTPTQTLTTPPTPTSTPTPVPIANTSTANVIQSISPISISAVSLSKSPTPSISIADDQGEVKSVFATESENDQIADSNSNGHSNILRNLFMIVVVLTTAIILIWYKVGKKITFGIE